MAHPFSQLHKKGQAPPLRLDLTAGLEAVPVPMGSEILSVDVETWSPETPCATETLFLLDQFREHHAKATFFIVGSVAQNEPDLVRRIAAEGHEIASHGWNHDPLPRKSPSQFYEEMTRSFDILSNLTGYPVLGFRAPLFSINEDTAWAFDVLLRAGFRYDSSIFPFAGRRYGLPRFPRKPVRMALNGHSILEIPLSTVVIWNRNLPVAGGGYFRLLPYVLIRRAVQRVRDEQLPFVVYCHPYEFRREPLVFPSDPGFFGAARASLMSAKFNLFRQTMRSKLTRLLREFHFTSIREKFFDAAPRGVDAAPPLL